MTICVLLCVTKSYAQYDVPDEERVFIYAIVPEDVGIPAEASNNLETKLQRILTDNGIADKGYAERFVLTAKIDILSKDVVPSTPTRISQKLDITFMVGDVAENKLYEAYNIEVTGVGTNETKSFISAFSNIDPQQRELCEMLSKAKEEIVGYYTLHCDEIISRATTLEATNKYDEAIFQLLSVPYVCADCYLKCQETAQIVYVNKINHEGATLLNQAKAAWAAQPNSVGASEATLYISQIDPQSAGYPEVEALLNKIESKLKEDEKKEWELRLKQIEAEQVFKGSMVEACKSVGTAWAKRRPMNWLKSIIHGWW